ncbi:MAG: transporter substrate-binding domain-containing protein, partial [Campylobacterales bacterium]|nr:transporter substrate-binding domain-containing protein [Campylobacterales bacterium]
MIKGKYDLKKLDNFIYKGVDKEVYLNERERQFLLKNPVIEVGGKNSKYDNEIIKLINQFTGSNFVFTDKKTDNFITVETKVKNKILTNPYLTMEKMILTSTINPKKILSLKDLDGKTLAIHKDKEEESKLTKLFPNSTIIEYASVKDSINSVVTGETDGMIGDGTTLYLANKLGLGYLKISITLNQQLEHKFAINNKFPEAVSIINKGLLHIGEQKLFNLKKKWFLIEEETKKSNKVELAKSELNYLKDKKKINYCIDPNWIPLEGEIDGKHVGISYDYIKLLKEKLPIDFQYIPTKSWSESLEFFKEDRCDLIPLITKTKERNNYINFSSSYLQTPIVLATKVNTPFIGDLKTSLAGKKLGIPKDYAFTETFQDKYPHIEFISVDNVFDGLKKVKEGKIFGFLGSLATIGHHFHKNFIGELKISGKLDEKRELRIGVTKKEPQLHTIIEKTLKTIDKNQQKLIYNKWVAVSFKEGLPYTLIWQIIFFATMVLLGSFYWNIKLQHEIKKRKIVEEELKDLNNTLEERVNHATLSLETKNKKLQESLNNFQDILDATMEMVVFYSIEKKEIININNSGVKMIGCKSKSEIIGRDIYEFILSTELPKIKKSLLNNITDPYELTLVKDDGSFLPTIISARDIIIDGENIRMSTVIDLSEIKNKEKLLQQ